MSNERDYTEGKIGGGYSRKLDNRSERPGEREETSTEQRNV